MAVSKTDGQRYIGIVVNNTDDPKKMGRVRVMIPQLHHPNFDKDKMPWMQLASTANENGQYSFDRPPQVGSTCTVWYPHGEKSSGFGIVESTLNGVYQPKQLPDNTSLYNLGWIFDATHQEEIGMHGLPNQNGIIEDNETGVERVTTEIEEPHENAPSIADKKSVSSTYTIPSTIQYFNKVQKVSTAVQQATQAMTSSLAALLPGTTFSLSGILNLLSDTELNEVQETMGAELYQSLNSILNNMGNSNPLSGTNFLQAGARMNPEVFATNVVTKLKSITTFADLDTVLVELLTDRSLQGLDDLEEVVTTVAGAFGNLEQTIDVDGNVNVNISDAITTLINQFLGSVQGINNAVGTLLGNSEILTDTYTRLSTDVQKDFKDKMEQFTALAAKLKETGNG